MTIRPHSLRRAMALLLTAACTAAHGCGTTPLEIPFVGRTSHLRDRPTVATAPAPNDEDPSDTSHVAERSPDETHRDCLSTAREMEAHGKHAAAIEQYERARKFAPEEPGLAARLAPLYDRVGQYERAAHEYGIALKEDPTNADLWNDFAYFRFQRAEFVDAERAVRRALVLDPDHKRSWVTLGLVEAELEHYDDAYAAFTKAVSPAAAHNNLGIILARQGKRDLARKELAEARNLDPTVKQPAAVLTALDLEHPEKPSSPSSTKRL